MVRSRSADLLGFNLLTLLTLLWPVAHAFESSQVRGGPLWISH
jgi:hypothetical protein